MSSISQTVLRILVCAGLGWLAGETISRTLLASPAEHPDMSPRAPVPHKGSNELQEKERAGEWQKLLVAQGIRSLSTDAGPDELPVTVTFPNPAQGRLLIKGTGNRLKLLQNLVRKGPEDFPGMVDDVASISDARVRRQFAEAFFAAWGQHDPRAAIEAANKIPGLSMAGLNGVLKSWVEKDPRGLMAWLSSSESPGWAKMQAQTNAFVYLTETDPRLAMQLATESGRPDARHSVFINWYRQDPEAADAWIAAAPEAERRQMFDSWVSARSANDPAAAWQLALTAPDRKQLPKILPPVFSAWQERDAPAARAALTKIPGEMWEPSFASLTGLMLGEKEAPGLDAMAAGLPKTAQDSFWAGAANGALESGASIEFAAAAFAHLPADDSDDRMSLAEKISRRRVTTDPQGASEWVRSLPHGRTRDMAAAALAEGLILTDPDAAVQWAADIQDDKMRLNVQKRFK